MNSVKMGYITFFLFVLVSFVAPTLLCAQNDNVLLEKVMRNDISAVKELLASGANINQQNSRTKRYMGALSLCGFYYQE